MLTTRRANRVSRVKGSAVMVVVVKAAVVAVPTQVGAMVRVAAARRLVLALHWRRVKHLAPTHHAHQPSLERPALKAQHVLNVVAMRMYRTAARKRLHNPARAKGSLVAALAIQATRHADRARRKRHEHRAEAIASQTTVRVMAGMRTVTLMAMSLCQRAQTKRSMAIAPVRAKVVSGVRLVAASRRSVAWPDR